MTLLVRVLCLALALGSTGLAACGGNAEQDCTPDCGDRVCGPVPNGCGDSCGTCSTGTCNPDTGRCVQDCQPYSCGDLGYDCGTWPGIDGCGGDLVCGGCPANQTCDASGHCQAVAECVQDFDSGLCETFGRLDGHLHWVVLPGDTGCPSDDNHVRLQVRMNDKYYDVAVNIESTSASDPRVYHYDLPADLYGGAWSEGWHTVGVGLDYADDLGVDSDDFVPATLGELSAWLGNLLVAGNPVSVFMDSFGTGGHNVHRNDSFADGAIVVNPLVDPHYYLFRFSNQVFEPACTPDCTGKECGDDGCGNLCPPGCEAGETCNQWGSCVGCTPDCTGKECGDDGCGSVCPPGCGVDEICNDSGQCEPTPIPWNISTVDADLHWDQPTSIAVDSLQKIHISFISSSEELKYTCNASGGWVTEQVSPAGASAAYASITVDSGRVANIAYRQTDVPGNPYTYSLMVADNSTGGWTATPVVADSSSGWYSSVAHDSTDHLHIATVDQTIDSVVYASNLTGVWNTESISSGLFGYNYDSSIAVDSTDKSHICFFNDWSEDEFLGYGNNTSGTWDVEIIEEAGYMDFYTSIAVDSNDNVHIAYFKTVFSSGSLRYVTNASGNWVAEVLDQSGDTGSYPAIAVDANNYVHIAYFDIDNKDLKHTTNASGSWIISTVDSAGDVGMHPAIVVDADNHIHIVYSDMTSGSLKYATTR